MGVALPASMGAYYSCRHDVVAVIGDGSVMMNIQEMQTISANKMGIKIIIINNKVYFSPSYKNYGRHFRKILQTL
jgi:acetolactate synthase-1/2/3 large subunit